MQAAGRRDRAGWLALFTPDGSVEDPVGSQPHIGAAQLGRFYDTFIGPREIGFDSHADFAAGDAVVRDVTLRVRMGPTVVMTIPAVLCYQLARVDDGLKVNALQAYWELPQMMLQFLRYGPAAAPAGVALTRALLTNQGFAGTAGFLRGFARPGRASRAVVADLLTAFGRGDELAVRRLLGHRTRVEADLDDLAHRLRTVRPGKILAAGHSITVSVNDGEKPGGVLIADFADAGTIGRLRFFG